jgi:branched-chain amino acid aminotransferase
MSTSVAEVSPHISWARPLQWVFVDGEFLERPASSVSVHAHALSYGTGTFEGIRGSWNDRARELYLLEPAAHYERMARSASVLGLELPYSPSELVSITVDLARRNGVRTDAYVRPLFVLGGEELPVRMHDVSPRFSIAMWSILGTYLEISSGARCMVSSWRRAPDIALPSRAKLTGSYVGPALAKSEAANAGYDEAIMLNVDGHVAEGTTSNLLMRRGNTWLTPPPQDDILEGITRAQAMELIHEETGARVVERSIDRSELYLSEELFLTGTAAQIVPVTSVDGRSVGDGRPGPTTMALAGLLDRISRRQIDRHQDWTVAVFAQAPGR